MGCLGVVTWLLLSSTVCAYVLTQLLVLDWRDGAVRRVGTGLPRAFTAAGTSGGSRCDSLCVRACVRVGGMEGVGEFEVHGCGQLHDGMCGEVCARVDVWDVCLRCC